MPLPPLVTRYRTQGPSPHNFNKHTIMKLKILLLTGLFLIVGYGCNEDDLDQLDPTRIVPENFFNTEGQLEAAVISGYSPLRSGNLVGRMYYFLNDLSDDLHAPTTALFQTGRLLTTGEQNSTSPEIGGYWSTLYLMVHRANTAIEGISGNESVDESVRNQLMGEARFLRGWAYNEIATKWGGAPLYTERVKSTDGFLPRSSREEVFAQAQSDLQFAADNLPEKREGEQLGRATQGSALGILARSYMETDNLNEAKSALLQIVNSGNYELLEDFGDNFVEENGFTSESLFEVVYAPVGDFNWNQGVGDGTNAKSIRAQEYGPSWRNVTPSATIVNLFENELAGCDYTDPRLSETVIFEDQTYGPDNQFTLSINANGPRINYHGNEVYANWYKYGVYYKREPGGYYTSTTNYIVMRYADVLLLLAEIEARQGNLDEARNYLNQVRKRAGVPNIQESCVDADNQGELIKAIIDERAKELASEAVRARDLRRWDRHGVIDASNYLDYWSEKQLLWPIPLQEIITNTQISETDQNPGYN